MLSPSQRQDWLDTDHIWLRYEEQEGLRGLEPVLVR